MHTLIHLGCNDKHFGGLELGSQGLANIDFLVDDDPIAWSENFGIREVGLRVIKLGLRLLDIGLSDLQLRFTHHASESKLIDLRFRNEPVLGSIQLSAAPFVISGLLQHRVGPCDFRLSGP